MERQIVFRVFFIKHFPTVAPTLLFIIQFSQVGERSYRKESILQICKRLERNSILQTCQKLNSVLNTPPVESLEMQTIERGEWTSGLGGGADTVL